MNNTDKTPPVASAAVEKPIVRGRLRRLLGREYYILRRRLRWTLHTRRYARLAPPPPSGTHSWIQHQSLLLRPLRQVDMQLQVNKITNLRLAIVPLNGTVIRPGESLSLWRAIGRPTRRKGYLPGLVLHNGEIRSGTGGGLCQLGNLIYWMALHTELEITERWRHSFDVFPDVNRTIPFACGATLAYNYIDLMLTNNTADTYWLHLWLDQTHLHGEVRCNRAPSHRFEVLESDHAIQHQWWGGYTRHNRIWKHRTHLETGACNQELVAENHAIMMYNPLLSE